MKQTKWLSEFSCLSEYTRLYPIWRRLKFRKENCMFNLFQEEDGSFCIILI